MYLLNFIIAICLPYVTFLSRLAPPDTVPIYFFSDEAAFLAGELYAVIFYWGGYLRNRVARGQMSEQQYFALATLALIYLSVSKILFALPFTWITTMFAFGLGVLSAPSGQQNMSKYLSVPMLLVSLFIFGFTSYLLIGMGWFGFTSSDYYFYKNLLLQWF